MTTLDNSQRLLAMMQLAIEGSDGTEEGAAAKFTKTLLAENDVDLIWDLFAGVQAMVVKRLYGQAQWKAEQSSEGPVARSNTAAQSAHSHPAPSDPKPTAGAVTARSSHQLTAKGKPSAARTARSAAAMVEILGPLSALDTFMIQGRPLGDVSPLEVEEYKIGKCERDRYFIDLALSGVPITRSGKMRDYKRPEEINECTALANAAVRMNAASL